MTCSISGSRIVMPFLDNLMLTQTYLLTVQGILNPQDPSANIYRYSLQITDPSQTSIIAKSYSPGCNFVMPVFVYNPAQIYLNYYLPNGALLNSLTTVANIQSSPLYIAPNTNITTSAYQRNIYLSTDNLIQSLPAELDLLAGSNPFPFTLTATTSGVNYLFYTKTGDSNFYANLPPFLLLTNKNYFTPLSFNEAIVKLPVSGVGANYTLTFTLPTALYPVNQVTLNVSLGSTVGLALKVTPTYVTVSSTQTAVSVGLFINDATLWTIGTNTTLIFTPSDTYTGNALVTLTAIAASVLSPTLSIIPVTSQVKSQVFTFQCSDYGSFVYHAYRSFSYNRTACYLSNSLIWYWSQQKGIESLRENETYYQCLDTIGIVSVNTPNIAQTITLSNLLASTAYIIDGFCQNQLQAQSQMISIPFSTLSNGGALTRMNFYFSQPLTAVQKIKVACSLALFFNLNYQRISTYDGYYCSELLNRLLLQMKSPQNRSSPFLKRTNRRVVSQPLFSAKSSLPHSLFASPRMLAGIGYLLDIYFGINNGLNNDNSPVVISNESNLTNIANQLTNNVIGLPTLLSYDSSSVAYIGTNSMINGPTIDVGPSYLYIKGNTAIRIGMQLLHDGLIYMMIGDSSWSRGPTIAEMKQGLGPDGTSPLHYQVLSYSILFPNSGNYAWTYLVSNTVDIYILISDNNPFDTANLGTVNKWSVTQEVAVFATFLTTVPLLLLLAFVIS